MMSKEYFNEFYRYLFNLKEGDFIHLNITYHYKEDTFDGEIFGLFGQILGHTDNGLVFTYYGKGEVRELNCHISREHDVEILHKIKKEDKRLFIEDMKDTIEYTKTECDYLMLNIEKLNNFIKK